MLCLGYPKSRPQPRKKLGIDVVVHDEVYQEMEDQELLDAFEKKYPGHRVETTPERLERIASVCRRVHGEAFAQRCARQIEATGYITPVQRYFGLHYRADWMPRGNEEYLETMEEFGFDWFKVYHLHEDSDT